MRVSIFLCLIFFMGAPGALYSDEVGREAAAKYFQKREKKLKRFVASGVIGRRYMTLHVGSFLSGEVYNWGKNNSGNVGQSFLGVGYRIGEWTHSMDLLFRGELLSYKLQEGNPVKLSFMPMISFPDAQSGFPLYFGAGVGVGIFVKQIRSEGDLSLDYQIVAGTRFFNLWGSTGLSFEVGLKNHVHILSDGQHKGFFVALGGVFSF